MNVRVFGVCLLLTIIGTAVLHAEPTLDEFPEITEEGFWEAVDEWVHVPGNLDIKEWLLIAKASEATLSSSEHYWAGVYQGASFSAPGGEMLLHPDVGFFWVEYGCLHFEIVGFGPVEFDGERLILHHVSSNMFSDPRDTIEFNLLNWGNVTWLVEDEQLLRYCQDLGQSGEDAYGPSGAFYLDRGLELENSPIPTKYTHWKDTPTMSANVIPEEQRLETSAEQYIDWKQQVSLDKGSESGLEVGMEVYVECEECGREIATVIESSEGRAVARVSACIYEDLAMKFLKERGASNANPWGTFGEAVPNPFEATYGEDLPEEVPE